VIIHEQDFFFAGSPWDVIFYEVQADNTRRKLPAPYDLSAVSQTMQSMRAADRVAAIWDKYTALVSYVANTPELAVVTSEDIVAMAEN
jgi:hypothetical protein